MKAKSLLKLVQRRIPSQEAVNAVVHTLKSAPDGLSSRAIFERIQSGVPGMWNQNPVQSMHHLKRTVLMSMQYHDVIRKIVFNHQLPDGKVEDKSNTKKKSGKGTHPLGYKQEFLWVLFDSPYEKSTVIPLKDGRTEKQPGQGES